MCIYLCKVPLLVMVGMHIATLYFVLHNQNDCLKNVSGVGQVYWVLYVEACVVKLQLLCTVLQFTNDLEILTNGHLHPI